MSEPFNLSNPSRKIHVGVLLPNSTTELLDVAPVDIFYGLQHELVSHLPLSNKSEMVKQAIESEIHWISETGKATSKLSGNLAVLPTDSFKSCPPLDILIIGASYPTYVWSDADCNFIRQVTQTASAVISICGGFQSLLQAGVLEGKSATAPRMMLSMLQKEAPGVDWQDRRWVQDGKIWTSGALLNGIDLMAAFARQTWGYGERKDLIEWTLDATGWNTGRSVNYDVQTLA